ncbi:NUDIX domain-containing protein [Nanoarchaeota archaeon]
MTVRAAAKSLIMKDGKFLIIQENLGNELVWDFPGGKIEFGETPQETVKREVKEEIGLDVEVGENLGVWWFIGRNKDHVVANSFLCTATSDKIDFTKNPADEEIVGHKWVTKEEFLENDCFGMDKSIKNIIRKI